MEALPALLQGLSQGKLKELMAPMSRIQIRYVTVFI
jgi:hypothetical protein